MSAGVKAGEAYVTVGVRMQALQKGLNAAKVRLQSFASSVAMAAAGMTAASGAILAPLTLSVKTFSTYGDSVAKASRRTGLAVDALAELGHAARLSGSSQESLEKGMRGLSKTMLNARDGLKISKEALAEIGLSYEALAGLSPQEQFAAVAEGIKSIQNPAAKSAIAMRVLGKSGADLIPLMDTGAEGIREAAKEARRLGIVMDEEMAAKAERVTDQMERAEKSTLGLRLAIGDALEPAVSRMAGIFTNVMVAVRGFISENKDLVIMAAKVGAALAAGGAILATVGVSAFGLSIIIGGLSTTLISAVVTPVTVLAAALGALSVVALESFGVIDLGLVDMINRFRIGGASISAWMQVVWQKILYTWEDVMALAWDSLALSASEAGSQMYRAFLKVAELIENAFWKSMKGIAESFLWIADKAVNAGYQTGLIDDKQLDEYGKTVAKMREGISGLDSGIDDKYSQLEKERIAASEGRWDEFYKTKERRAQESGKRSAELAAIEAEIFRRDEGQADPISERAQAIWDKVNSMYDRIANVAIPELGTFKKTGDDEKPKEVKPAESVFGSFSAQVAARNAVQGTVMQSIANNTAETNKLIKQGTTATREIVDAFEVED
jgi:hypothetical protein